MKTITAERKLEIIEKLLKMQIKESHIPMDHIGPHLKDTAEAIGENAEDVAAVFIPLYKQAVDETLEEKNLLASIERGWHGHHGGGH